MGRRFEPVWAHHRAHLNLSIALQIEVRSPQIKKVDWRPSLCVISRGAFVELGMPEVEHKSGRFSSRAFRLTLAAAVISLIGTTFAINININGDNKLEFGQGIYQISSCDQFVQVALKSSSAFADGYSRVGSVQISGLDVERCANTSIRLRLYDAVNASPMDLYNNIAYTSKGVSYPCCTETGTAVIMVIAANATQSTAAQSVSLISPSGKSIGAGDRHIAIRYEATTGLFSVTFTSPLAIMRDVDKTTLESASNV